MSISCVAESRPNIVLFPSRVVGFQEDEDNNQKIKLIDPRQKRYSLETKASFIFHMLRREEEEVKSNLSWYAQDNGVSRTWLYKLAKDFKSEFGEWKPGPKGRDGNEELAEKLQEELRKRDEELAALKAVLRGQEASLGGQEKRIIRTILQACVCPVSIRQIRDLIFEAFGVWISKGKIKMLIAEYSMKAQQIMQEMGPEKLVEFLGGDEIFCGCKPILTGVDLNSFAVVLCERAGSRDHKVWHEALKLFPSLKLVCSDRAKGIVKAVYLCGDVRHQFDLFHFKRDAHRLLRRLEAMAYQKIELEYKAQVKMGQYETSAPQDQWQEKYLQYRQQAYQAIDVFERAEKAIQRIFEGLEVFDQDGKLKDPQKSLKQLYGGVAMLEKAGDEKKIKNLAKQARDPRLLLYLTTLRDNLLSVPLRWQKGGQTMPRNKVIEIIGRHWYWSNEKKIHLPYRYYQNRNQWREKKKELEMQAYRSRLASLLQLRQLQMSLANYQEVFQVVTTALNRVFRASSLIESFNSQVRVCQQVKKELHKQFLSLLAMKWNMTPFEEGKRKGRSPFQILGLQNDSANWLDLLTKN